MVESLRRRRGGALRGLQGRDSSTCGACCACGGSGGMTAPKLESLLVLTEDSGDDGPCDHRGGHQAHAPAPRPRLPDADYWLRAAGPPGAARRPGDRVEEQRFRGIRPHLTTARRTIATKLGRETASYSSTSTAICRSPPYMLLSDNVKKFDAIGGVYAWIWCLRAHGVHRR